MTRTQGSNDRIDRIATIRTVLSGILILLLIVFILQNLEQVTIDFLVFTVETSMLVAMLICALLGAAATLLITRRRSKS